MTIVSPTGVEYEWNGANPPTANDIAALQAHVSKSASGGGMVTQKPSNSLESQGIGTGEDATHPRLGASGGLLAGQVAGRPIPGQREAGRYIDTALEVGLPTAAQAFSAPGTPAAMAVAGGAAAGIGNALAQLRRMAVGEQDGYEPSQTYQQTALGSLPVGGPGAIAVRRGLAATVGGAAKMGGQMAANSAVAEQVGSLVKDGTLPSGERLLDAASLPAAIGAVLGGHGATGSIADIKDSVRNQIIRSYIKEGGKVPPSMVEPTFTNKLGDWVGNKANIAREASAANEATGTRLAKVDAGIPMANDISPDSIKRRLDDLSTQYYEPIQKHSPEAATALEEYKNAKVDLGDAQAVKSRDRTRESKAALKDAQDSMDKASSDLEGIIGKDAMSIFKQGEQKYAKAIDVRESSNLDSGSIDPSKLAMRDILTGNLEKIARFNGAVGNGISKELTRIQSPIMGRLFSGLAGGAGYAAGGLPGAAAGVAVPIAAEELVRRLQLSNAVQSRLAQPKITYAPSVNDGLAAYMAQLAANSSAQDDGRLQNAMEERRRARLSELLSRK